jgi:hypothetical protein
MHQAEDKQSRLIVSFHFITDFTRCTVPQGPPPGGPAVAKRSLVMSSLPKESKSPT